MRCDFLQSDATEWMCKCQMCAKVAVVTCIAGKTTCTNVGKQRVFCGEALLHFETVINAAAVITFV